MRASKGLEKEERIETSHGQQRAFAKFGGLKESHWNGGKDLCICTCVRCIEALLGCLTCSTLASGCKHGREASRHRSCPSAQSWGIESVPSTL